jgi:hypothetical protein
MERTVPVRSSEEIDLYIRTIYSLLRSTTEVQIRSFEEVHAGMNSTLHPGVRDEEPDISALIYSILRLPECIINIRTVLLGQSASVFAQQGLSTIESWQEVSAKARRRRFFYDGKDRLACYIASRSDIDDVVPCLTALQIEWNKLHGFLRSAQAEPDSLLKLLNNEGHLAQVLHTSNEDLSRLRTVLGNNYLSAMHAIASRKCSFQIQLISGSLNEYRKATQMWWENIVHHFPSISDRPVYFVSSNTHSLINPLSGFALKHQTELINYIHEAGQTDLLAELNDIQNRQVQSSLENFFYYVLKKFQATLEGQQLIALQREEESQLGIVRIPSEHAFDIEAQVIEISKLDPLCIDQRISPCPCASGSNDWEFLRKSDAIILNIDYPLGLAAYNILSKVAENTQRILGIYIMGKSATLNGVRGDVMLPNVVHDEHSQNTYLFNNCFAGTDVSPYLVYGTVLDNQKAVSVLGTFLQNSKIMDVIYREGYSDIEMESGPYLSAVYEMFRPKRHPVNEIVNLYSLPFDFGILHYASDTPLTKGKNLGAGALSYFGVDSTYATTLAILRRIMHIEKLRIDQLG